MWCCASLPGTVLVSTLAVTASAEISSSFGTIVATFCKNTFSKASAMSTISSVGWRTRGSRVKGPLHWRGVKHVLAAPHLVVDVAVGEHSVEVLQTLCGTPVVVVLQPLLNSAQVHWWRYDVVVILIQKQIHHVILEQPVLLYIPLYLSNSV